MMEQELIKYLSSFGALGIMCAWLFTNVMKEKKEDRDMYKTAMDKFIVLTTEQQNTNQMFVNSIQNLVKDVTEVKQDVTTIRLAVDDLNEKLEDKE